MHRSFMKETIKSIIKEEFLALIENISSCMETNIENKKHNFLLHNFSEKTKAHMVFVSCFESQSGNRIEHIARKIAKLRYGEDNVPNVIKSRADLNINFRINRNKQYILTHINYKKLIGTITQKIETSSEKLNSDSIKELLNLEKENTVTKKDVDLAFYDENNKLNIIEIKAGGGLDSRKAPSDLAKLLSIYVAADDINAHVYFATIYNFNGEGNSWNGQPSRYFDNDLLLIGSAFWNKILPSQITYSDFVNLYTEALDEIALTQKMEDLINRYSE